MSGNNQPQRAPVLARVVSRFRTCERWQLYWYIMHYTAGVIAIVSDGSQALQVQTRGLRSSGFDVGLGWDSSKACDVALFMQHHKPDLLDSYVLGCAPNYRPRRLRLIHLGDRS